MTISDFLEKDHLRLEEALRRATESGDRITPSAFAEFREGLLRHIGMEEKILFPEARKAAGGKPLPFMEQLHLDHGALAALLVPTPNAASINAIRTILSRHNTLEEGSHGFYRRFETLPGLDAPAVLARLRAAPPVALNPHNDSPIALESMQAAVSRAGYAELVL